LNTVRGNRETAFLLLFPSANGRAKRNSRLPLVKHRFRWL